MSYYDRVQVTSTTTGAGTYTLGGAVIGYRTFSVVGNGNSCKYCAQDVDGSGVPSGDWEVGIGTYTAAGTTLSRDTILSSSNANSAVNWGAGTRRIFITVPAALLSADEGTSGDVLTSNGAGMAPSFQAPNVPIVHQSVVTLTDSQIKLLPSTEYEVIPAAGAGKAIIAPVTRANTGTIVYMNGNGTYATVDDAANMLFYMGGGPGTTYEATGAWKQMLTWGGPNYWFMDASSETADQGRRNDLSEIDNVAVLMSFSNNGSSDPLTGGPNTMTISSLYYVIDLATGQYV